MPLPKKTHMSYIPITGAYAWDPNFGTLADHKQELLDFYQQELEFTRYGIRSVLDDYLHNPDRFLRTPAEELKNVTVEQALAHPNWSMGAKITIDSSTLVNKGFEVIEAKWLFGLKPEQIDVLVHPQSIVHSMVEFDDGAIKAQLGAPDMHLPIQFALRFPHRGECGESRFSFADNPTLTFERVDDVRFPMLNTAYECLRKGGNSCCVMNGANEVAVASFLGGRIKYIDIAHVIQQTLSRATFVAHPSVEDYALSNEESRRIAEEIVRGICNK